MKIQCLNETQMKVDLDYFDYVNVGWCEQRERRVVFTSPDSFQTSKLRTVK